MSQGIIKKKSTKFGHWSIKFEEALEFESKAEQEQQKKPFRQMVASHKKTICGDRNHISLELEKGLFINTVLVIQQSAPTEWTPNIYYTFGKDFKQDFDLMKYSQIYSGEKPHVYNACGRRFSQSLQLIEHQRVHSGEQPNKCSECGKNFSHHHPLVIPSCPSENSYWRKILQM